MIQSFIGTLKEYAYNYSKEINKSIEFIDVDTEEVENERIDSSIDEQHLVLFDEGKEKEKEEEEEEQAVSLSGSSFVREFELIDSINNDIAPSHCLKLNISEDACFPLFFRFSRAKWGTDASASLLQGAASSFPNCRAAIDVNESSLPLYGTSEPICLLVPCFIHHLVIQSQFNVLFEGPSSPLFPQSREVDEATARARISQERERETNQSTLLSRFYSYVSSFTSKNDALNEITTSTSFHEEFGETAQIHSSHVSLATHSLNEKERMLFLSLLNSPYGFSLNPNERLPPLPENQINSSSSSSHWTPVKLSNSIFSKSLPVDESVSSSLARLIPSLTEESRETTRKEIISRLSLGKGGRGRLLSVSVTSEAIKQSTDLVLVPIWSFQYRLSNELTKAALVSGFDGSVIAEAPSSRFSMIGSFFSKIQSKIS